jgi:valyl-tRNA synthetase
MPIDKTYDPAAAEARHYARWEASGAFACNPASGKPPYTIMMPPPNVTGSLHMGHALTFTLQDILARYHRMIGCDVLWQPGTDHAGIATQMVVERQLAAEKTTRQELGREQFLEKVWAWKAASGGTIMQQLRRLGASADWGRERFTMDAGLNKAVNKVFVELYNQKLIYRAKRLVNWDPKLQTAISDLEVEQKDIKGHMWHIRYPLADKPDEFLCIATTRPETMLGDGAVAVHPDDARYQHLIGKWVSLPLTGRLIPIIADLYPDPEKGSGAVKITAAHDFNDFEVWQRHRQHEYFTRQKNGGLINLFDSYARLNANCPQAYQGLDRFEARKQVISDLEALGLLDKIEPITHVVPHGDRSGVVLEPWLSDQWYVDAATLAKPALTAVESGQTEFVPEQWKNTYFAWLRNIQPWCISRQLWWGHQIPVWYDAHGAPYVGETEAEAQAQAGAGIILKRDPDVLDTWFSSALWPFSTLGWPDDTALIENRLQHDAHGRPYLTDVLVTGFDIIFFWVARMMMATLHVIKDKTGQPVVPFKQVYIHALVRDEKGQKMSKSKGNVIDPLVMIDQYGCDALRFTLTALSTPGRDIKLASAQIEGYRNFATKLWNAARFCEMNGCVYTADFAAHTAQQTINQWIIGKLAATAAKLRGHYAEHRFDLIAQTLYHFAWHDVCDWYVELAKPILQTEGTVGQAETRATAAWVLAELLKLLHPVMPFITEELWAAMGIAPNTLLMQQAWPDYPVATSAAVAEVNWLIALISTIRTVRSELNVPAGAMVGLQTQNPTALTQQRLATHAATLKRLARIEQVETVTTPPAQAAQIIVDELTLFMPLAGLIDLAQERARLEKQLAKTAEQIAKDHSKLGNAAFVANAPEQVVTELQERIAEHTALLAKLQAALVAVAA